MGRKLQGKSSFMGYDKIKIKPKGYAKAKEEELTVVKIHMSGPDGKHYELKANDVGGAYLLEITDDSKLKKNFVFRANTSGGVFFTEEVETVEYLSSSFAKYCILGDDGKKYKVKKNDVNGVYLEEVEEA